MTSEKINLCQKSQSSSAIKDNVYQLYVHLHNSSNLSTDKKETKWEGTINWIKAGKQLISCHYDMWCYSTKIRGQLLGCSTGGCLTIQIKQKLFDNLKSWDVQLRLCSTENWQLSNIKLIKLNQKDDYVRLILISTLKMDNCQT